MKVIDLKVHVKERGLRGYSRLKKAELITFLQNNLRPSPALRLIPAPRPPPKPTPRPIPAPKSAPRLIPAPRPSPKPAPRLIPAPRPPPRLIPALKPYQLKPKRGKETFVEPPMEQEPSSTASLKQIKFMKKKLGKLNKKIRHSKKKHNNLISKRNSIKKKIKELKVSREPKPEESFNPIELEQALNRAYRSYRINGKVEWT